MYLPLPRPNILNLWLWLSCICGPTVYQWVATARTVDCEMLSISRNLFSEGAAESVVQKLCEDSTSRRVTAEPSGHAGTTLGAQSFSAHPPSQVLHGAGHAMAGASVTFQLLCSTSFSVGFQHVGQDSANSLPLAHRADEPNCGCTGSTSSRKNSRTAMLRQNEGLLI